MAKLKAKGSALEGVENQHEWCRWLIHGANYLL